jgi:hypothetical protein
MTFINIEKIKNCFLYEIELKVCFSGIDIYKPSNPKNKIMGCILEDILLSMTKHYNFGARTTARELVFANPSQIRA